MNWQTFFLHLLILTILSAGVALILVLFVFGVDSYIKAGEHLIEETGGCPTE